MNRRDLLKALAASGAVMTLPTNLAWAASQASPDRFLVILSAGGGWDVTSICDPKGDVRYGDGPETINWFTQSQIRKQGNLKYAPIIPGANLEYDWMEHVYKKYYQDMIVVNGVNCLTGSHAQGNYFLASGQSFANFPTIGALHSAPYKNTMAVPYYAAGQHSETAGEVSPVQINSAEVMDKFLSDGGLQPDPVNKLLQEKRQELLDHLGYDPEMPSKEETWKQFKSADLSSRDVADIANYLPDNGNSSGPKFQAEMCAALLASGQCAAAGFKSSAKFDTHADSDARTALLANTLFEELNSLISELERHGIAEKTTIMIGSEFGRTPWLNGNKGRDHWATGSVILMGKGLNGNRTIGQSTDGLRASLVNPETLQPDENGIKISIQHVHRALRDHLGMGAGTELNSKYPMPAERLNIFG